MSTTQLDDAVDDAVAAITANLNGDRQVALDVLVSSGSVGTAALALLDFSTHLLRELAVEMGVEPEDLWALVIKGLHDT